MPGKLFDRLESVVFKSLNSIMSVQASWVSVDGTIQFTGPVLFNNPTMKESKDQTVFVDSDPYIEYLAPAFNGLKTRVDSQGSNSDSEIITVDGVDYYATQVNRIGDGNNYKVHLQLVNDPYGPQG